MKAILIIIAAIIVGSDCYYMYSVSTGSRYSPYVYSGGLSFVDALPESRQTTVVSDLRREKREVDSIIGTVDGSTRGLAYTSPVQDYLDRSLLTKGGYALDY